MRRVSSEGLEERRIRKESHLLQQMASDMSSSIRRWGEERKEDDIIRQIVLAHLPLTWAR